MGFFKWIIYKIFDEKIYLKIINRLFFISYYSGFLKVVKIYKIHYFVKKLIQEGDSVIDLGANLGFYSVIFSKLTGIKGKVYSIEPIEIFRTILSRNTRELSNVEIILN